MKKLVAILITIIAMTTFLQADENRTLGDTVPADSLERIVLEVGVGDVEVTASDSPMVKFEIVLEPRRGGLFSSKKRALREVQEAAIKAEVVGATLRLSVKSDSEDRRFEERWTLEVPARLAFALDFGVGDVEIRGVEGGVDIEAGVSDILIDVPSGPIEVELGVGDVTVTTQAQGIGRVECSTGVGDAHIRVEGKRVSSEGFIGHSASYKGDGEYEIEIEVGVGDAMVRLK